MWLICIMGCSSDFFVCLFVFQPGLAALVFQSPPCSDWFHLLLVNLLLHPVWQSVGFPLCLVLLCIWTWLFHFNFGFVCLFLTNILVLTLFQIISLNLLCLPFHWTPFLILLLLGATISEPAQLRMGFFRFSKMFLKSVFCYDCLKCWFSTPQYWCVLSRGSSSHWFGPEVLESPTSVPHHQHPVPTEECLQQKLQSLKS